MLNITSIGLRSSLAVAAVALLPLTEAAAQALYTPSSPPRDCMLSPGAGMTVRIVAGQGGTTTGAFPVMVACPSPHTGTCLEWEYNFFNAGFNISNTVVAVDADTKVVAANPTNANIIPRITGDSSIQFGFNNAGEVGFKFTANNNFTAKLYTPVGVTVGTVSAGFQGGNRRGYCAIAGVGSQTGDPLLTLPLSLTTTVGPCTITWTQSPDGCVSGATASPSTCTVTNRDLVVGGQVATTATCATEIAGPFGSTEVCRWNSILRKTTCVTVP